MTAAILVRYCALAVAGLLAHARRLLRGWPCPCELCAGHRAFIRESATAYRAEVRGLVGPTTRGGA